MRERSRILELSVLSVLIVVAGAGEWDLLFERALWVPGLLGVLLVLRLMDDLGSLSYDRKRKDRPAHARVESTSSLRGFMTVVAVLSLALTLPMADWTRSIALATVLLLSQIAYAIVPMRVWSSARHAWVHVKYPLLVVALAWPADLADIAGAIAVYALFGMFELVDDPKFHKHALRIGYASIYGALVAISWICRGGTDGSSADLEGGLIAGAASIAFGIGVRGNKGHGKTLKYVPFAVALLLLVISGNRVVGA